MNHEHQQVLETLQTARRLQQAITTLRELPTDALQRLVKRSSSDEVHIAAQTIIDNRMGPRPRLWPKETAQ